MFVQCSPLLLERQIVACASSPPKFTKKINPFESKAISQITKAEPQMWGSSIVGFGTQHYKYESGREGDWFVAGFSPRKQNLTLYIMAGFSRYEELLGKLGKFTTGKILLVYQKNRRR